MKRNKITKNNSSFPDTLLTIAQVPDAIFHRGAPLETLLAKPCVAIVGSRKLSHYGQAVTAKLASELAKAGVVIISGLALGVDSVAHRAALDAGGITIAVLPCGIDTIYPAGHFGLAKQILQNGGALISEYDGNDLPQKHQFIARNRLIAGLCQAVVITEAAAKSGSLHTAEFALEQGTEVFAVPGNITSPTSEGTNSLIKTGATPVTSAEDILQVMDIEAEQQISTNQRTPEEQTIIELMQNGLDDLVTLRLQSKLEPAVFTQTLTMLEVSDSIKISSGKAVLQ